jgi:hypothetical protein
MARLRPPQLPAHQGNEDLVRALLLDLRAMTDQLNALSDGLLSAATSAQAAAPTTGAHAQGDFIRNSKPVAGGVYGWVCVADGTPGVWKTISIGA